MNILASQELDDFTNGFKTFMTNYMKNLYYKRRYISLFGNAPSEITDWETVFNSKSKGKFVTEIKKRLTDFENFKGIVTRVENIGTVFDFLVENKDILTKLNSENFVRTIKIKLYEFYFYEEIHGEEKGDLKRKMMQDLKKRALKYSEQLFDKKIELEYDIIKYFADNQNNMDNELKQFIFKKINQAICEKLSKKELSIDLINSLISK